MRLSSLVLLLASLVYIFGASTISATKFQQASMIWTPNSSNGTVSVSMESVWRLSYPWMAGVPTAGKAMSFDNFGQVYVSTNFQSSQLSVLPAMVVKSVDTANNNFLVAGSFDVHLPNGGQVVFDGCCRDFTLQDYNNDIYYTLSVQVPIPTAGQDVSLSMESSNPVSKVPVTVGVPVDFHVPIQGKGLQYSVPPPGRWESSNGSIVRSSLNKALPQGAFLGSTDGILKWTPDTIGLYAIQFMATDANGGASTYDTEFNVVAAPAPVAAEVDSPKQSQPAHKVHSHGHGKVQVKVEIDTE